jgi:hypothetical protein
MSLAGRWAGGARTCAAWGVLGVVAWQALEGGLESARELARRPRAEHLRAFTATPERLIARRLGPDLAIYRILRTQASEAARVVVVFDPDPRKRRALRNRLMKLESLLYPIVLVGGSRPAASAERREVLVLDLDSGRDFTRASPEILGSGGDWRILRLRTGPG